MGKILSPIVSLLQHHKKKMFIVLLFAVFFFVVCFPNDDLSDYISMQVSRGTGLYVQFDKLRFELIPSPGLGADNLVVEPKGPLPPIHAGSIHGALAIGKLLTAKLGVALTAKQLFHGDVDVDYAQDGKAKSGAPFDEISIHAEKVSIDELCDFLRSAGILNMKLQGLAKGDIKRLRIDHGFAEQPNGLFTLEMPGFTIPSQTLMVDFNGVPIPQQIPTLELGRLSIKNAKLNGEGVLEIPDLTIGDSKSDINGTLKGTIGLNFRKIPAGVQPEIGAINLTAKLGLDRGFIERNQKSFYGSFLSLIPANLKQDTAKGTQIAFSMKLARLGETPTFTPPSEKP